MRLGSTDSAGIKTPGDTLQGCPSEDSRNIGDGVNLSAALSSKSRLCLTKRELVLRLIGLVRVQYGVHWGSAPQRKIAFLPACIPEIPHPRTITNESKKLESRPQLKKCQERLKVLSDPGVIHLLIVLSHKVYFCGCEMSWSYQVISTLAFSRLASTARRYSSSETNEQLELRHFGRAAAQKHWIS